MKRGLLAPVVLAAALAVSIGVAGCGGAAALDPVAKAADTTAAAGSAEFRMTGSVNAAGQSVPISASGVIDPKNLRGDLHITTTIPSFGQLAMEEILAGHVIYMKMPAQLASRLPGGKQWMKLDLDALGKRAGVNMAKLLQGSGGGASNPADLVRYLKAAGNSTVVGKESVNGVQTTHYKATIDPGKALGRIGDKQAEASLKQLLATAGVKSIPLDVWIDGAGRMRREQINFSTTAFAISITVDLVRFGVPVSASPPPDSEVFDASSLISQALPGGG